MSREDGGRGGAPPSPSNLDEARAAADKVRLRIQDHPFRTPSGEHIRVTVSLGCAAWEQDREEAPADEERLVAQADHSLYRAKANGRNRVEVWEGGSEACTP